MSWTRPFCVFGVLVSWAAMAAHAEPASDFYRGKTIDLYTWTSVGGAYDTYSRLIAQYIGKHIPGTPAIVARNMEGAGGLRLTNYLYAAAVRDGLTIGTISRGNAFDPLLGNKTAQFDGAKFNWLGSANNEVSVCVASRASGVVTFQDALTRELVVGASGPTADTYQFPKVINAVLGTEFKIVTGYGGGNEIDLAMERGEVQGRCGWSWTSVKGLHKDWLETKKINVLFQMGLSKHPDLPDTPLILDLARTPEEQSILKLLFARQVVAWPYVAPPGVPRDRVETLRQAFSDTLKDQDFLTAAESAGLDVGPVSGVDVQKLVQGVYETPKALTDKVAEMLR